MARANLNIQSQISEEFLRAHESKDVRLLKIKIHDEDLVLDGVANKVGTAEQDFSTVLLDSIEDNQALFVLYNASDEANEKAPWVMIAWVPDGCRVRDKMLYSSSREDLKRTIGLGFFQAEYAANQRSDLTWQQYKQSLSKTFNADILTETERLVIEEKTQSRAESSAAKSSALGVLPFELSAEVIEQLEAFKSGACNWVEMTIVNEVINLLDYRTVTAGDLFASYIDNETASFIAVRLPRSDNNELQNLFIFSCPENTPVRIKMTMSSSKASVLAAAQNINVTFDKTLEIRDADEVDEALRSALNPNGTGGSGANGSDSPLPGSSGNSSSAANISHGKPARPGRDRGKVKVSKFKLDDAADDV